MDDENKAWLALLSMIGEITKELKSISGTLKVYVKAFQPKLTAAETKSLRKIEQEWEDDPNNMLIPPNSEEEEVLMDLKDVQCVAVTEMAMLVTKKGFQKWIPFSQIVGGKPKEEEIKGTFFTDIPLTPNAEHWIPKKKWDKFQVI